ncbi:MAG: sugar ABC transporter ATP-binding protein [Rhizobiaceae bacterium]|nr:sugar ABC transporter ATP-binding protein [Rhizobiaceae bacterium]
MAEPFLELVGITKTFPGVAALSDVTFSIAPGEVVGLVGENGAGKSTLMKILGGVTQPTAGELRVDGARRDSFSVPDAIRSGIAFVHQELNLFDNLDVAANIFIGREPLKGGPLRLVDREALRAQVEPLLARLKVGYGARTPVRDLSIAQQQLLEIVKALSLRSRLVIMDEPTSSLTLTETDRLMSVIDELRADGVGIIFISHRLHEVERCADRVVVLRDGRMVGELAKGEITHERMIRLMIGRDLKSLYTPPKAPPGATALAIDDVVTSTYPGKRVSLEVRSGEILGLAGLVGSGRTELANAVFGIEPLLGGSVSLDGTRLRIDSPRDAIRQGIYLAPEDRKSFGLLLDFPIVDNISLPDLASYASASLVNRGREIENADRQKQRLNIRAPNVTTRVGTLSGGNQQKVVLAKWLSMKPRVIIFDEPTRGVDVGAKKEIYELLRALSDAGVAILMISSDMEEVVGVSDRVAVMHEGTISGFLRRDELSEHSVLRLAVGTTATKGTA